MKNEKVMLDSMPRWRRFVWTIVVMMLFLPGMAGHTWADTGPFRWSRNADGVPYVDAWVVAQTRTADASGITTYSPTIYAVGTDEVPSDAYNPSGGSRANKPGIRTGHGDDDIHGPEYGNTEDYSPVGEPLVLLLYAVLFAGVLTFRKAKKSPKAE